METLIKTLNIQEQLEANGLDSTQELLTHPVSEISRKLNLTQSQTNELLSLAATEYYPWKTHLKSTLEIPSAYLSTDDPGLDSILGEKGIPIGSITEVVGESSSGKTQLSLQLCFSVQKPKHLGGLNGGVYMYNRIGHNDPIDHYYHGAVYLYSEGKFSTSRCHQLATYFEKQYNIPSDELKQHIHTLNVSSPDGLFRAIAYQLPILLERSKRLEKKIKLVVIDSIGATYRGLYTGNDTLITSHKPIDKNNISFTTTYDQKKGQFEQLNDLCELGLRLKKLALQYQLAIIVVNQVSDKAESSLFNNDINKWLNVKWIPSPSSSTYLTTSSLSMFMTSLSKKPILGITWANSVTTRIRMAKSPLLDNQSTRRALFIENAPHIPLLGGEVFIDDNGIHA